MAIIEFVSLSLKAPYTSSDTSVLSALRQCQDVIQSASKLPTTFLADVSDPSRMYVIGGWPSKDAHYRGFNGSEAQAGILKLIVDKMDLTWQGYFDIAWDEVGLEDDATADKGLRCIFFTMGSLQGVEWRQDREYGFEASFRKDLDARKCNSAWNIKKEGEDEDDVWVLFEPDLALPGGKAEDARPVGRTKFIGQDITGAWFKSAEVLRMRVCDLGSS